jgi:hypothetical protein
MTNAKTTITKKAEELIDKLVQRENDRFMEVRNSFYSFLEEYPVEEGGFGTNQNSIYRRVRQFSLKEVGCLEFLDDRKNFYNYRTAYKVNDMVNTAINEKSLKTYLEEYRIANRVKLVRAIEKYITDDMVVKGKVNIDEGVKGVEVSANVKTTDGVKKFKTRAIFAGGYIQRYHYRYRGDLVNV